jgi:hypothetical protein
MPGDTPQRRSKPRKPRSGTSDTPQPVGDRVRQAHAAFVASVDPDEGTPPKIVDKPVHVGGHPQHHSHNPIDDGIWPYW